MARLISLREPYPPALYAFDCSPENPRDVAVDTARREYAVLPAASSLVLRARGALQERLLDDIVGRGVRVAAGRVVREFQHIEISGRCRGSAAQRLDRLLLPAVAAAVDELVQESQDDHRW